MSKWPIVRLGDYIEQIRGVSYKPENLGNKENTLCIPLLRANNIQDDGLLFEDLVYVDKKRVHNKQVIKKGDIIICTSSGSKNLVGKAAQASCDLAMTFGAFCKLIRAKDIEKRYLAHYFSSPKYRHTIAALSGGVNINNLRNEHIDDLTIYLPPLETQKKIADVLDKAKSLIDLRKKQIEKMDLLIKSKFIEMFGDPVTNPKGWPTKELKDITSKIGSGATPRGGKESYIKYGICLIRSMNVHNGKFKFEELAHIDDSQAKQLDNVIVFENDVLINITGASVARSCVVPKTTLPARVNQHVSIIRCDPKVISCQYMNKLLINDSYQKKLLSIGGAGGATREAITKRQLELLEIPLPPLDLQNQFACFVELVEKEKKLFEQALDKIEINYKSLMQEYFG